MPTEIIKDPAHNRRRSLGRIADAWIAHFLVHGPGDVQGRSLRRDDPEGLPLDDEFRGIILDCYALDEEGKRLYDDAHLSRAKGRAKSELAAFIVLFDCLGPSRFAGWADGGEVYEDPWGLGFTYTYKPGEPMGKPISYPFARCMATEELQAGNTYDNIHYNCTEEEAVLSHIPGLNAGLSRIYLPKPLGGEIRPSTAAGAGKDGGKETIVVFDEVHLYTTNELRNMWETVQRNGVKRKDAEPWFLQTTTMFQLGEDSIGERTYDMARKIMSGETLASRLYYNHREAPPDVDFTNPEELKEALREVYGPFADVMDLDKMVSKAYDIRTDIEHFKRYFMNYPAGAYNSWVFEYEWKACEREYDALKPGTKITLGFDGSRKRERGVTDSTALIACRVSDGRLFELLVENEPAGIAGKGWEVPVAKVDAAVHDAFQRYKVVGMYADPAKWESYVAGWEASYGRKAKAKVTGAHPFHYWMTGGRSGIIARAVAKFHSAILQQEVTHAGEASLFAHIVNTRRKATTQGIHMSKEHPQSENKIDAAVAAMLAWNARLDALAAGAMGRTGYIPKKVR